MVMASLGEETRASCRGPSNHNAIALILPHKALLGFTGGAIGADVYCDRAGIQGRKLADCARILDALKDADDGYYDSRDPFTTVPRSSILATPYLDHAKASGAAGRLSVAGSASFANRWSVRRARRPKLPIVTAAAQEIKTVLGNQLGATLVESSDPLWKRDPDIEQMKVDFRRA